MVAVQPYIRGQSCSGAIDRGRAAVPESIRAFPSRGTIGLMDRTIRSWWIVRSAVGADTSS
jgi:hypothetical protein